MYQQFTFYKSLRALNFNLRLSTKTQVISLSMQETPLIYIPLTCSLTLLQKSGL
jgi:hypothetical protein